MQNKLNLLSPNFRDFLLSRNIITDSITNSGLDGLLYGIGGLASISNTTENVQASPNLEVDGEHYKDLNIIQNKFQVDDDGYRQSSMFLQPGSRIASNVLTDASEYQNTNLSNNIYRGEDYQYSDTSIILNSTYHPYTTLGSYLDSNGNLNLGGPSTQPLDILGSILGGGGIGFDPNNGNAVPNYDVRSSLSGRLLNAGGLINDTKLGQLSVGYLASALANNIAFNLQEETIGNINLNPLNLLMGGNIITANYRITVAKSTLGKAVDLLERILGFERPVSILDNSGSIFISEAPNTNSLSRALSMISNTGKGQILSLFANLNANTDGRFIGTRGGFAPQYEDDRTERGFNKAVYSGNTYPFTETSGGLTSQLDGKFNINFDENLKNFDGRDDDFTDFVWTDDKFNNPTSFSMPALPGEPKPKSFRELHSFKNKNGILYKTKELFKTNKMRTLTSGKFITEQTNNGEISISKGSGVRNIDTNTFCRVWTVYDKYDKVEDLQKNSGLNRLARQGGEDYQGFSVLDNNGFVRIGPYDNDDTKRFMFSIENLAWIGETSKLLPSEIGNGDLITGNKGRIMWFPPYDMTFNETTSVSWDKNHFIGRGEPIYTYNNTERTGNLTWKIVIDHPNYLNFMKGKSDSEIASFFAGCLEMEEIRDSVLTENQKNNMDIANNKTQREVSDDETISSTRFNIYFANDSSEIPGNYENGLQNPNPVPIDYSSTPGGDGFGLVTTISDNGTAYVDNNNFGLNGAQQQITIGDEVADGWIDSTFTTKMNTFFKEKCKFCKITIKGFASEQGNTENNLALSERRAQSVKNWFLNTSGIIEAGDEFRDRRVKTEASGLGETGENCSESDRRDNEDCKKARLVTVNIEYSPELKNDSEPTINKINEVGDEDGLQIPVSRFYNEEHYFKQLQQTDPTVYSSISEKIQFFHPSFHAITPEGFNSRLTFLQQCTRQGPTVNGDLKNPNNLAFGRPPICILRIGDFYHTKIIIDNLTCDYDPLVWDLNPEGVGVQPMIVTVNMSFAFIGGSSLNSPINRLQNAISFNYFANTEVYDPRAARVGIGTKKIKTLAGEIDANEIIDGRFPDLPNKLGDSNETNGLGNPNDGQIVDQEAESEEANKKQ